MGGYHSSRWYKRHPEDKRPEVPAPNPEQNTPPALQTVRRIIGPSFIIAGAALMDTRFWGGFALACVGFVLLIWEVTTEPELIKRPAWVWLMCEAGCFCGFAALVIALISPLAPLNLMCYSPTKGEYPAGTTIEGIEWNSHFAELRIGITNATDDDYEKLDLAIYPDAWVHKAVISPPASGCQVKSRGGDVIGGYISKGGEKTFTATRVGEDIEMRNDLGGVVPPVATSGGYRLLCDNLPSHFTIKVVFAIVSVPDELLFHQLSKGKPGTWGISVSELAGPKAFFDVLGHKPVPSQVKVMGRYRKNKQPFTITKTLPVINAN